MSESIEALLISIRDLCKVAVMDLAVEKDMKAFLSSIPTAEGSNEVKEINVDELISCYESSFERICGCLAATAITKDQKNQIAGRVLLLLKKDFTCTQYSGSKCGNKQDLPFKRQESEYSATEVVGATNREPMSRKRLSSDDRALLERLYEKKKKLNKKERQFVAERCGLSPQQVRVWFANKRRRAKSLAVKSVNSRD